MNGSKIVKDGGDRNVKRRRSGGRDRSPSTGSAEKRDWKSERALKRARCVQYSCAHVKKQK